jgi:peptidoglycan/LPS O-acetylase OafA/YrhL
MKKNRYITGYSGLRALAVIGVILYHLNPNTFVGGYLGVPVFFVLSGYLVTDHMLASYEARGFYDNSGFYLKRLKRLYPQLISVCGYQQFGLCCFNAISWLNFGRLS